MGDYLLSGGDWASAIKQAMAIGRCEMAQMILDLEYNQLGTEDGK